MVHLLEVSYGVGDRAVAVAGMVGWWVFFWAREKLWCVNVHIVFVSKWVG